MTAAPRRFEVRQTDPRDFDGIIEMCRDVYRTSPPWTVAQLESHLRVFPTGQIVAVEIATRRLVGMAASLIIRWDDYEHTGTWRDFTSFGTFTNHDPQGRTLYGAEVMVRPGMQRQGVGKRLYRRRREIVEELGLRRIRAGARLRGYHRYAEQMSAEEYVIRVVRGELHDPTLSFQLKNGFEVLAVVADYLMHDARSLGYAALIEWMNPKVGSPTDTAGRDPRFRKPEA